MTRTAPLYTSVLMIALEIVPFYPFFFINIDPENPIDNGISDSSNGLSPDRRHAVVWTYNDPFRRRILRHQASKWKPVTIAIDIIMSEPKRHVYKSVLKFLNVCIFHHILSVSNLMILFKIICSASCNGLPPNRWLAVAWTSNDPVHRYILCHPSWTCWSVIIEFYIVSRNWTSEFLNSSFY